MYEYEENSEIIGAHCTLLTPPIKATLREQLSATSAIK